MAFEGQQRAWLDAAELVDHKWARAVEVADEVPAGWRRLFNDPAGDIALGQNTHELVVRFLSAVVEGGVEGGASAPPYSPLSRSRLITSDGEFHTIRRQLDRLAETGVEVVKVAASPVDTLADRLAAAVDDRTACVLVSSLDEARGGLMSSKAEARVPPRSGPTREAGPVIQLFEMSGFETMD